LRNNTTPSAYRARLEKALNEALESHSFVLMTPALTKANRFALAIRAEAFRDALEWLDEEDATPTLASVDSQPSLFGGADANYDR